MLSFIGLSGHGEVSDCSRVGVEVKSYRSFSMNVWFTINWQRICCETGQAVHAIHLMEFGLFFSK